MAATYSLYLKNPNNEHLRIITDYVSFTYTRSVNAIGTLQAVLPLSEYDPMLFKRDGRLEVWRRPGAGMSEVLDTGTQWLISKVNKDEDNDTLQIEAQSGLVLIDWRVIAYAAGAPQSSKSGAADSVIVELVKENLGADATDSNRDWSSLVDIRSATGNGPTVAKSASRKKLLTTIQEVAQQAANLGTPVFFDMTYNPGTQKFIFQTYLNQRGNDLSGNNQPLTLSSDFGSLAGVLTSDDYSDERTFVYAAGQGQGDERVIVSASDGTRIGQSPFGRKEMVVDGRNTDDPDELTAEAEMELRRGRPVRTFNANIISRPRSAYGVNWNWGDRVKVQTEGQVYTARIDTVGVSVGGGKETINAAIRIE